MFSRFMEGRDPTQFTLREKATFVAQGVLSGKIFELAKPANVSLWNELSRYFARPEVKEKIAREVEVVAEPERRAFLLANIVSEQLAFRFFQRFVQQIDGGKSDRGHASAYRYRAASHCSVALHLRVSQSGALAQMVAGNFPGNDRHGSGEFAQH